MFGEGFASAEASFFSSDGKETKRSPGTTPKTSRFQWRFPRSPCFTGVAGGGWGFRWAAKSAKSTAALRLGQKSQAFYGSYMIRPPGLCKDSNRSVFRWVARRHRPKVPTMQRRISFIARDSLNTVGPPYMAAVLQRLPLKDRRSTKQSLPPCLPLRGGGGDEGADGEVSITEAGGDTSQSPVCELVTAPLKESQVRAAGTRDES